jgi:hypothetical protein
VSEREPGSRESAAYRAGYAVGGLARLAIVAFTLAIAALALSSLGPEGWQPAIRIAALASGAFAALALGAATRNWLWLFIGVYVVLAGVGSVLQGLEPKPKAALIVVSVGTVAAVVGAMVVAIRGGRRSRELERFLFSESTSIAFFVTMLGAVTYALLEAWLDAPKLSMWLVWSFGMLSWIVASSVFKRRYS